MMGLEPLTEKLRAGLDLSEAEIAIACEALVAEESPVSPRADFLRSLHLKGERPAEIAAFVRELLAKAERPAVDGRDVLDVCGTGGDRAGLFNVSTAVMFVVAASGVKVVKHGNRGITSKSGGADVLEALGVRIDVPPGEAGEKLERAGCCFLFAPHYHPALKAVGPVRKTLAAEGIPTIFNLLGPLLNPAAPSCQLTGVFRHDLLATYAEVFRALHRKRAWAVHGTISHGGLDEISTLGRTEVCELHQGKIREFQIDPKAFDLVPAQLPDLLGGAAEDNAAAIIAILGGERGPKRDIVALNAAGALVAGGAARTIEEGLQKAADALDNGSAREVLELLRSR